MREPSATSEQPVLGRCCEPNSSRRPSDDPGGLRATGGGRKFYPAVAAEHHLDDAVLALPGARPTGQPGEVLLPLSVTTQALAESTGDTTVVYGPVAPLVSIGESLRLARRAADLLAAGHADPEILASGGVVPVSDLAGELLVFGTPLLTQMSIDRHLGALSALAADLRLQLAEILLDWLVTGDAVSQIAERQGVPMNTGYSRLSRARGLVGEDALSDAPRRFEITIALYSMVPLWRGQPGE